jgi:alkanesulfonate monooxygenase SsuD/methylene tetrahydromethanopterin reductase-like flavin-dependent oxidoreductase (luciferase family)
MAKALATVDNLSNGRLIVTAGIGWSKGEFENLGYDFHNRGKRMNEAVKVLRTCWRGQKAIDFQGEFYKFKSVVFSPSPVQSGGPPLWLAGDSEVALSRAIALSDGWHPNAHSPDELQTRLTKFKTILQVRPFIIAVRIGVDLKSRRGEKNASTIGGSPSEIIEQLEDYQQSGMNYAIINLKADNQAERERFIKQFSQEIMPAFS